MRITRRHIGRWKNAATITLSLFALFSVLCTQQAHANSTSQTEDLTLKEDQIDQHIIANDIWTTGDIDWDNIVAVTAEGETLVLRVNFSKGSLLKIEDNFIETPESVKIDMTGVSEATGTFDYEIEFLTISEGKLSVNPIVGSGTIADTNGSHGQLVLLSDAHEYLHDTVTFQGIKLTLTLTSGAFFPSTVNIGIDVEEIEAQAPGIPTLSQWGLIVMVLLLLSTGAFFIVRRQQAGG